MGLELDMEWVQFRKARRNESPFHYVLYVEKECNFINTRDLMGYNSFEQELVY